MQLINHISFVDCPGHEAFMNNMLSGSSVMDKAVLVEASNADCFPQPQTREHLIALQNTKINDLLVIQNKCDLVKKDKLEKVKFKIEEFLEDFYTESKTIIPIIAQTNSNINLISNYFANCVNSYSKDLNKNFIGTIIRTFDINRPNTKIKDLKGGILGGSIARGVLKLGDFIQILPGRMEEINGEWIIKPIYCKVKSLCADKNKIDYAIPGGLIGIGTTLDPGLCKGDKLVGQIITYPDERLSISKNIIVKYKQIKINGEKISFKKGMIVKVCLGSNIVKAIIKDKISKEKKINLSLNYPICISSDNITIMVKLEKANYKIASIGKIIDKKEIKNVQYKTQITNIRPEYILTNDLIDNYDFNLSYNEMLEKLSYNKIQKIKYDIPRPILSIVKKKELYIFKTLTELSINALTIEIILVSGIYFKNTLKK